MVEEGVEIGGRADRGGGGGRSSSWYVSRSSVSPSANIAGVGGGGRKLSSVKSDKIYN